MPELHLLSPAGFRAAGVAAGIKSSGKTDVGLLVCDRPATAAALFTTNRVAAAPVVVGRAHIAGGKLRGIVMNSGNANACTGKKGHRDALRMCALAAETVGGETGDFLPGSTGIIGHMLPMDRVESGIRQAAAKLGNTARHALAFADAILTTDLVRKSAAVRLHIGKQSVTIAGVCKGSGMIGPRLALPDGGPARHATMLAYLTTDANIAAPVLARLLADATEPSFNAVTVDDHASTNDTVCILASRFGAAVTNARARAAFGQALSEVCLSLAKQIAADGEGATKIVQVRVTAAASDADAKLIARTIANSPLVKCALHGNDPNWGRIVSAAGYCGARFDPDRCRLRLQGTPVFRGGQPVAFNTAAVSRSLKSAEVVIDLDCGIGKSAATIWTCDLSKEYVTINADYHT